MRSTVLEYSEPDALTAPEAAALASVVPRLTRKHILDIGVGGGRTFSALNAIADSYVGIDYVPEMVAQCRRRFPWGRFEQGDARSMPQFRHATFDLIVFSCNGICMMAHAGRVAALQEVRRLLRPGGHFVFSCYNRNSEVYARYFMFPDFAWARNPARLLVRSARFVGDTVISAFNRARYVRHEVRRREYSILNDRCHHYRTLLYYIDVEGQLQQLQAAGFHGPVAIYDLAGHSTGVDATDDSLLYVVSP